MTGLRLAAALITFVFAAFFLTLRIALLTAFFFTFWILGKARIDGSG